MRGKRWIKGGRAPVVNLLLDAIYLILYSSRHRMAGITTLARAWAVAFGDKRGRYSLCCGSGCSRMRHNYFDDKSRASSVDMVMGTQHANLPGTLTGLASGSIVYAIPTTHTLYPVLLVVIVSLLSSPQLESLPDTRRCMRHDYRMCLSKRLSKPERLATFRS